MSDKVTPEDDAMRAKHGVPVHTPPTHTDQPSVHDLLIDMIQRRKDFGKEKYGTELQAGNGRDALADMLDEVIDLAVYTVKEIEERKLAPEPEVKPEPVLRWEGDPYRTVRDYITPREVHTMVDRDHYVAWRILGVAHQIVSKMNLTRDSKIVLEVRNLIDPWEVRVDGALYGSNPAMEGSKQ